MKTYLITLIAVALFSFVTSAQNKFEFMIIGYYPTSKFIGISINGSERITEELNFDKGEFHYSNLNPLISKVNDFQEEGWEVISFDAVEGTGLTNHYAYLRRKKLVTN